MPSDLDYLAHSIIWHYERGPNPGLSLAEFIEPTLQTATGKRVAARKLLSPNTVQRAVIVGGAGVGKTTLLQWLAYRTARDGRAVALRVAAPSIKDCISQHELLRSISGIASKFNDAAIDIETVEKWLYEESLQLLIDGLDEIGDRAEQERTARLLSDFARQFGNARIFITSRPSTLSITFGNFTFYNLAQLDESNIATLTASLAPDDPLVTTEFLGVISQNSALKALAGNPLLLRLLFDVFRLRGRLPENLSYLYADFTDYLFSTWEERREKHLRTLTLEEKHAVLSGIALFMFDGGLASAPTFAVVDYLGSDFGGEARLFAAIRELVSVGILGIVDGEIRFSHLSFQEFYTARALISEPDRLRRLVTKDFAKQVLLFASGMIDDVAPIVEAAVERGNLLLAARALSLGRSRSQQLIDYTIRAVADELGETFVGLLVSAYTPITSSASVEEIRDLEQEPSEQFNALLNAWDRFSKKNLRNHEKGALFEEFAASLFSSVFRVVSRDLQTESGELDLVLEIIKPEPFWIEFGGDALVECKNWNSNTPVKEVLSFTQKATQARVKLAFFVSVTGFTNHAKASLAATSSNLLAPLIVPIDGEQIKEALARNTNLEEFFKERIRAIKYLRKY